MEMIGPLQTRVMHTIWRHKDSNVHDVHDRLNNEAGAPKLAYTTILTVMRNLVRRNMLNQEKSGRSHTFLPMVTEFEYKQSMIKQVCEDFFSGDKEALKEALK